MSRRIVLGILGLIIALNGFVIGYVLIDRALDSDDSNDEQAQEETMEDDDEQNQEAQDNENQETENAEETETEEAAGTEEKTGSINGDGGYTENEEKLNASAIEKSEANRNLMEELGKWIATNYAPDDINTKEYTVQRGDTLWEISEAYYGTGSDWGKILELNKDKIGYLPNGSQALIVPGQVLVLE